MILIATILMVIGGACLFAMLGICAFTTYTPQRDRAAGALYLAGCAAWGVMLVILLAEAIRQVG